MKRQSTKAMAGARSALAACLLGFSGLVVGTTLAASPALAAPPAPAAPTVLFTEDFENVSPPTTPILLTSYTGAGGQTYTADPVWVSALLCNGIITSFNSTDFPGCGSNSGLRSLAQRLGSLGTGLGNANHALSAFTAVSDPGPDKVEFETVSAIPLTSTGRFITFSVDSAVVNCFAAHPLYKFYLTGAGPDIPTFTTPIDPCTDPRGVAFPNGKLGSYPADKAVLFTGSTLGIKLINGQGSASGNDAAIDNIRILDATPQLSKEFAAGAVSGRATALTFTITNTTELAAKAGWSFTDTLPAGMTVATPSAATTTCASGAVTAAAGSGSITASGNLNAGQASCTVTVNVTATTGTYTNGPENVTSVGLNPITPTPVSFAPPPVSRAAVVAKSTDWTLGDALPGAPLPTFSYGTRPLTPMMGDWNGDGLKTVGTFEYGTFKLNNQNDNSEADIRFTFGDPRGYPIAGDYDGNGYDDVAVYRCGLWQIHYLGPGAPADQSFTLGAPFATDCTWPATAPVAGDWDGDGIDGIGTVKPSTGTWVLKNTVGAGSPDIGPFTFGPAGAYPVVGDWGGNGFDTPGYRVGTTWTVRTAAVTSGATSTFDFGVANSVPFSW